jgi:hypothetical protein
VRGPGDMKGGQQPPNPPPPPPMSATLPRPPGHRVPPTPRLPGGWAEGGYLPPCPNPSAPSGGGGRRQEAWLVMLALAIGGLVAYGIGYQVATDSFERKLEASEAATGFVVGSCDP